MNLKDELRKLSSKNREEIMLAFEAGTPHYLVIKSAPTENGRLASWFVGVNLTETDGLKFVEAEGMWSLGYLTEGN